MKSIAVATALVFAAIGAHAGVAPNTGASQMSQSGAKLAPSKKAEEQPQAEAGPQEKTR